MKHVGILGLCGCSVLTLAAVAPAYAQATAGPATTPTAEESLAPAREIGNGDIVVTARRREESLQTVPVSVQAFSAETLQRQNVVDTTDLQRIVPGVIINGGGTTVNTAITIRGQGRDVVGPIAPSVLSYVNEVPLPSWGNILPTFDVATCRF